MSSRVERLFYVALQQFRAPERLGTVEFTALQTRDVADIEETLLMFSQRSAQGQEPFTCLELLVWEIAADQQVARMGS